MGTTGIILAYQDAGIVRRVLLPLIVTLSLVASQLVLVGLAPAEAAAVPWTINGSVDGGAFRIADSCGGDDDAFAGGINRNTVHTEPAPVVVVNSNTVTSQTDLCNVYVDSAVVDGDVYAYLAFDRDSGNGTQTVYFELGQNGQPAACVYGPDDRLVAGALANCNPFGNRTAGDVLVTLNSQGSGNQLNLGIREFDGTTFSGVITPPSGQFMSALSADGRVGEAWINLTAAGVFPDDLTECLTFANVIAYTQTGSDGATNSQPKDIVLADLGQFTGIRNCGEIEVTKVTDPAGIEGSFDISLLRGDTLVTSESLGHGESFTYGDGEGEQLFAGNDYRIDEVVPAGWSEDYDVTCTIGGASAIDDQGDITVEVARTTRCTVTNYADDAEITVSKDVTDLGIDGVSVAGDDLAGEDDFGLAINGDTVASGSTTDVTPGQSYTISESQLPGYTLTDLACDGATVADGGETASVTPTPGQQISCTFTNEPVPPTLTLRKILEGDFGGLLEVEDFELSIGEDVVPQDEPQALPAGSYTISEDGPENLHGYEPVSIVCVDEDGIVAEGEAGDTSLSGIDLALGQDVICTFTNAEIAPTIALVKELGDTFGGDLAPADFDLTIDGGSVALEADGDAASSAPQTVDQGFPTVAEDVPDGYTLDSITCLDANGVEVAAAAGPDELTVPVVLGDEVTCTFVNSEVQPTVTLVKELGETFGGDRDAADFDLELNGEVEDQGVAHGVDAGDNTVAEDVPDGYELVSITCVDGDDDEVASTDDADSLDLDVALGDDITCTFVNDEIQPTVTVVKQISTDLDGPLAPGDFDLELNGEVEDQDVAHGVDAGDNTVSEHVPDGYSLESITCVDGDGIEVASTDDATSLGLSLSLGDEVTCTFVNAEIAPTLTLVKVVDPAFGGGLGPDAFDLRIDGRTVTQGQAQELSAGTFTIDEVMPDGADDDYELTSIVCDDGQQTSEADSLDVTLGLAEDVTCTFTNAEIQPSLTLLKELGETYGGQLAPADFDLRIDGESVEVYGQKQMLGAGSYDIDEVVPDGYAFAGIVCDNDQSSATNGLEVVLGLGDDVTCTFTNDEVQPQLTLVKELGTTAGGTLAPEDFTLTLDGEAIAEQGTAIGLDVGSYTIAEVLPDGYVLDSISCDDGTQTTEADSLEVALGLGDDVECKFTNSEIAPQLTVVKVVDGGPAEVDDFTLRVNDGPVVSGESSSVLANTPYTVTEDAVADYVQTSQVCVDDATEAELDQPVVLALGQTATCTLVNAFTDITLAKTVVSTDGDELILGEVVTIDGQDLLLIDEGDETTEITYSFVVTNSGNATLYDLVLDDPLLGGPVDLEVTTLAPGESTTATATYTVTLEDIATGSVPNTASVTGSDAPEGGNPVSDTDDANVDLIEVLAEVGEPGLEIVKEALIDEGPDGLKVIEVDADGTAEIVYRYTITNTGTVLITDLTLDDDVIGDLTGELDVSVLAPGQSTVVEVSYLVTAADLAAGSVTNVGTVTGDSEAGPVSADDDETVTIVEVLAEVEVEVAAETRTLPRTGAEAWVLMALSAVLAAIGAAALLFTPRRRTS